MVDFGGRSSVFDFEFESRSTRNTVPFDFFEWNRITDSSIFPRFEIAYTELSANPCFSNETPSTAITCVGSSSSHVPRGDRCDIPIGRTSDFPRESLIGELGEVPSAAAWGTSGTGGNGGNGGNSEDGGESS